MRATWLFFDMGSTIMDETAALARSILAETPCLQIRDLAVNGHDLMALGLRGKAIGGVQRHLLDKILEGELLNEKREILWYLEGYLRENPDVRMS